MSLTLRRLGLAAAAPLALAGLAAAQFSTVAAFTGNAQETFETQSLASGPFPTCVTDRVFAGQADLCAEAGSAHITGGWGFSCTLQPFEGSRQVGSTGGALNYTFDTGVTRFGGWFATNNPTIGDGTIEFYGAGGVLLHSDVVNAPLGCTWTWNGWDTGGALVTTVRVIGNYGNGDHLMMDGMEADIVPGNAGVEYCFCDGGGTASPCGNPGAAGNGCANGADPAGAHLGATGFASVGASSLVLHGSGLVPNQPGLYFQGDNAVNGGGGNLFGDGLRCAGGNVVRIQVIAADASGNSATTADVVAAQIQPLVPGDVRRYQLWYRDPAGSPCGSFFNLTNGVEVTWLP
ncbi:MAG: hypothetical protein H6828_09635 [Planctomycetes bacterium]|nr:hypothetical protein [Planctomycetota bacterium]